MEAAGRAGEQGGCDGLVGEAVRAITRHIRKNELMPGDRLPREASLSRALKASRPVVREALRSLAAMRIIALRTGRRATVGQAEHGPISLLIEHGIYGAADVSRNPVFARIVGAFTRQTWPIGWRAAPLPRAGSGCSIRIWRSRGLWRAATRWRPRA
jgi:hypothetical protein